MLLNATKWIFYHLNQNFPINEGFAEVSYYAVSTFVFLLLLLHRYLLDIPLKNNLRPIGKEAVTVISLIIIYTYTLL